ncbi:MAG: hypothetical protein KZQ58_07535 [gamma proteobacterium symbiont of Bathyaustriella thionipta]|nr:hypothetical protein [gamma proteobacterium symbiont of Bathyaustriella thionipta]
MKYLVALLVLTNIIFFTWSSRTQDVSNDKIYKPLAGVPQLQTVAETQLKPPLQSPSSTAESAVVESLSEDAAKTIQQSEAFAQEEKPDDTALTLSGCEMIGPFKRRRGATEAANRLAKTGLAGQLRRISYDEVVGYWVLLPPASNRVKAKQDMQILRDAGFNDLWLFRQGDLLNAISLGLFTHIDRAQRLLDQVSAKVDLPVEIRQRVVKRSEFWVEIRSRTEYKLNDELWESLQVEYAGLKRLENQCGSVAELETLRQNSQ